MLQIYRHSSEPVRVTEYSVIIALSRCSCKPRTPTSSATPDAFTNKLWVVIVRTFAARCDGAVGGSARIINNYGRDQRYSRKALQAAECFCGAAVSFLRGMQCTNWDKKLKGLSVRGQVRHCGSEKPRKVNFKNKSKFDFRFLPGVLQNFRFSHILKFSKIGYRDISSANGPCGVHYRLSTAPDIQNV